MARGDERFGKRFLRVFLPVLLSVVVIGSLDLFRLRSQSEDLSQTIILLLLAPFYPDPTEPRDATARSPLVVTLERSLVERLGATWPLSFPEYANVLRRIDRHRPRAVFIDLFFVEPRGSREDAAIFTRQVERMRARGTPVFLAAPNPCLIDVMSERRVRERRPGRGLLLEIDQAAPSAIADWAGYGDSYPLVIDVRELERAVDTENRCGTVENGHWKTPAFALFASLCEDDAFASCEPSAGGEALDRFGEPMIVRWSAAVPSESGTFASLKDCGLVNPDGTERVLWSLEVGVRQLLSGLTRLADRSFERFPSVPTLHGSALFPTDPHGTNVRSDDYDDRLDALLRDRVVLVGADLFGTGDTVLSPVHGTLPGVYLHAMALENLIRFGDDYWRESWDPRWRFQKRWGPEVLATAFLLAVFAAIRLLVQDRASPESLAQLMGWMAGAFAVWVLVAVLVLGAAMALVAKTNVSPLNWLGASAVLGFPLVAVLREIWKSWRSGQENGGIADAAGEAATDG